MTAEQTFLADIRAARAAGQGKDHLAAARDAGFHGFADLAQGDPSPSAAGRYGRSFGAMVAAGPIGAMAVGMRLVLDRETGIVGIEDVILASAGPDAGACERGIVRAVAVVFGWGTALPGRVQLILGITGGDAGKPSVPDMPPLRWSEPVPPASTTPPDAAASDFAAHVAGTALLDGFAALGFADPALPVGPGAFLPALNPA